MMWQARCEQVGTLRAMTPTMSDSVSLMIRESDQSSPKMSAQASSKDERPDGPGAFQGLNSIFFLLRGLSGGAENKARKMT